MAGAKHRNEHSFGPGNQAARGRRKPKNTRQLQALQAALVEVENECLEKAREKLVEESLFDMDMDEAKRILPDCDDPDASLKSLFKKMAHHARLGDNNAQKLILERLMPKPKLPLVNLGKLSDMPLLEAIQKVTDEMTSGTLAPDVAEVVINVLASSAEAKQVILENEAAEMLLKKERTLNG